MSIIHVSKKEVDDFHEIKDAYIDGRVSGLDIYPFSVETLISNIWGDNKDKLNIKETKKLLITYLHVNKLIGDEK